MLLSTRSYSALTSDTTWEVRTTGNDDNGGGYDTGGSGTDYSLQDAAQLTLTDLACANNTTLTSVTGGFTAAMVDNIIQIKSGTNFTAGFYEITARTDTNTVTLDRNPTNGSNATSGTGSVGGALLTITKAMGAMASGNDVYVRKGTYAETVTPAVNGATANPCQLIGYNSTRTDNPTGANRPDVTGSDIRTNCMVYDKSGWLFKNMRFHNATGIGITGSVSSGATSVWINCKFDTNGNNGFCPDRQSHLLINCESSNNTGDGFCIGSASNNYINRADYCYSHDNAGKGFTANRDGWSELSYDIADTNTSAGFSESYRFLNCVAYGNGSDGFYLPNGENNDPRVTVLNNISSGNTGCGFKLLSSGYHQPFLDYNQYDANNGDGAGVSTNSICNISTTGSHNVTGVVPGFTNAAAGDFSLVAGSACLNTGMAGASF